jgi:hypothetical protein
VTCARGLSSEADLARGGVQPSSEADLARGGVQPQPCRSGGPRGPPGMWSFSAYVFRLVNQFAFCVFYEFKRVSPCCLGDPHGCPRHLVLE